MRFMSTSGRIVNVEHRDVLPNASLIAHFQQLAGEYGERGIPEFVEFALPKPVSATATTLTGSQAMEAYDTMLERADDIATRHPHISL